MEIRIDAFLSKYGFSSRRNAKHLIEQGRVKINGETADTIVRIDTDKDKVELDGNIIDPKTHNFRYIIFHKPLNVLSTTSDDRGRKTVLDYVKVSEKVYPVGRLDLNSTGLMLLTNDGALALKLTHPRYHVPKKYIVETDKRIDEDQMELLRNGVELYGTLTMPAKVTQLDGNIFEMILDQGMKRQVREMCKAVGLEVVSLKRTQIGSLVLGDLKPGEFRELSVEEIEELRFFKASILTPLKELMPSC